MKLTFYLFKESVKEFDQAIAATKFTGTDAFQELRLKQNLPFEAKAYFQKNKQTKPKWLSFLGANFDIDPSDIMNVTNSFLLLVRVQDRVFALSQGFGFNGIDRNQLERGFGLRVALNEIDPKKLNMVDFRKIDLKTKQKRVLLSRGSPLYDFDFDVDEDLLNLISGEPTDLELGKKMVGSDSLTLTGDTGLFAVGQQCDALLQAFLKEGYKERFAFVDNLRRVKDKRLIEDLEKVLADAIEQRQTDKIMLAYPEIENLNQVERFKLMFEHRAGFCQEVDLEAVYNFLSEQNLLTVVPKEMGIVGLNAEDEAITKKISLHDYLVFEANYNEGKYLLSLGTWFEIAKEYVEQVDRDIDTIEEITDRCYLPPIRKGQREDEYNSEVAQATGWVLLDKKNFSIGGYSRVEVSDLLSPEGDFICVKKYNDSSTLSHLFSQGYVSAALLNDETRYRDFVLSNCPNTWTPLFDANNFQQSRVRFVFAIATNKSGKVVQGLPFFSKINLRRTRKDIERLGFKVKLYRIGFSELPVYLPRLI